MLKKLLILSADDDGDDQDLIEEALKLTGFSYDFVCVPNGQKLLQLLSNSFEKNEKFPDLIFLDLNMPVKSGRETLKLLKDKESVFNKIPVSILTTSGSYEDRKFCTDHGADNYLVKPTSFTELHTMIEQSLLQLAVTEKCQ
jgi:CheY-like chemotaxis protein